MGIAWITGNAGTGKSTVCRALAEKGYRSIDSDMGMAVWVDTTTHEVTEAVDTDAGSLSPEWFRDHKWLLRRSHVEELAEDAGKQPVFLCGLVQNDEEFRDLFDVKICLILNETTMRERIGQRRDNPFGKAPAEVEAILHINDLLVAKYIALGAALIDASRPVEEVVQNVLRVCGAAGMDVRG